MREIIVYPCCISRAGSPPTTLLRDTFWCQIASVLRDVPILPRLSVIHFVNVDAHHSIDMGALRLLNPCIRELTIKSNRAPSGHETKLKAVFASCFSSTPNLERLSLQLACSLVDFEALPRSHPRLRHLRVAAPVTALHLTSIASLPELESLSVCLSEPTNTPLQFEVLRVLDLSTSISGLDSATTLFITMDAPRLCKVSIASLHINSLDLRTEIFQCLHPLTVRFPCITAFHWGCSQIIGRRYGYRSPRDPGATLTELIEPLLSLRTLRDLSLEFQGPVVPYSPSDFHRMAEAWPNLEALALALKDEDVRNGPYKGLQYADYDSLAAFALHCPRLHTLRIPRVRIDTVADIPGLPADLGSRTSASHQLRRLSVWNGVLCLDASAGYDGEARRNRAFTEMMKPLFPFATVHFPVTSVVSPPTVVVT